MRPDIVSWPIVELRQYTLVPGRRDTLIDLFETHFVEAQEATGIGVIGQFRDLSDPDRFVWMRGFDTMPARRDALRQFYFGPVWAQHREAANATMVDSDNVLLLRPAYLTAAFRTSESPDSTTSPATSVITVCVLVSERPVEDALVAVVRDQVLPEASAAGGEPLGIFITENAVNTFPELPVRDEHAMVWLVRHADDDALGRYRQALAALPAEREARATVMRNATRPLQELHLRPTTRSHLR